MGNPAAQSGVFRRRVGRDGWGRVDVALNGHGASEDLFRASGSGSGLVSSARSCAEASRSPLACDRSNVDARRSARPAYDSSRPRKALRWRPSRACRRRRHGPWPRRLAGRCRPGFFPSPAAEVLGRSREPLLEFGQHRVPIGARWSRPCCDWSQFGHFPPTRLTLRSGGVQPARVRADGVLMPRGNEMNASPVLYPQVRLSGWSKGFVPEERAVRHVPVSTCMAFPCRTRVLAG